MIYPRIWNISKCFLIITSLRATTTILSFLENTFKCRRIWQSLLTHCYLSLPLLQRILKYPFISRDKASFNDQSYIQDYDIIQVPLYEVLAHNIGINIQPYEIHTDDGYIITILRCYSKQNEYKKEVSKRQILLLPTIFQDCTIFLCSNGNSVHNIVKRLTDEGYDVWLANNRGHDKFARHSVYNIEDSHYWRFSMNEIAQIDLPLIIYTIQSYTLHPESQVSIISLGNGYIPVTLALNHHPNLNISIKMLISLCPSMYQTFDSKDQPMAQNCVVSNYLSRLLISCVNNRFILPSNGKFSRSFEFLREKLHPKLFHRMIDYLLALMEVKVFNPSHHSSIDMKSKYDRIHHELYQHILSSTSMDVLRHYLQIICSQRIQSFNDNASCMSLFDVLCPCAVFLGSKHAKTVTRWSRILSSRSNCVHWNIHSEYEIMDFIWGRDAYADIYPELVSLLQDDKSSS